MISSERGIHIDARGKARNYNIRDARLAADLASVAYDKAPWKMRYPELAGILGRNTTLPTNVRFDKTLVVDCVTEVRRSASPEELAGVDFGLVARGALSLFKDPAALNFELRDSTALQSLLPGFEPIPLTEIGLQPDMFRPDPPARDLGQLLNEPTARRKFDSQTDVDASNRH